MKKQDLHIDVNKLPPVVVVAKPTTHQRKPSTPSPSTKPSPRHQRLKDPKPVVSPRLRRVRSKTELKSSEYDTWIVNEVDLESRMPLANRLFASCLDMMWSFCRDLGDNMEFKSELHEKAFLERLYEYMLKIQLYMEKKWKYYLKDFYLLREHSKFWDDPLVGTLTEEELIDYIRNQVCPLMDSLFLECMHTGNPAPTTFTDDNLSIIKSCIARDLGKRGWQEIDHFVSKIDLVMDSVMLCMDKERIFSSKKNRRNLFYCRHNVSNSSLFSRVLAAAEIVVAGHNNVLEHRFKDILTTPETFQHFWTIFELDRSRIRKTKQ